MSQTNKISQKNAKYAVAVQSSDNNQFYFFNNENDYIAHLMKGGKKGEVGEMMKTLQNTVGQAHPFFPHYVYKTVPYENKIVFDHEPINEQAAKENPLMYKGQFKIKKEQFGDSQSLDELFTKSMINQQEIEVDVDFIETWIGNTKLEDDEETLIQEAAKTARWFIAPEELPPPMKIKVATEDDTTILDYIELNISDIDKKKRVSVLDNSRQTSCPILVQIVLNQDTVRKNVEDGEVKGVVIVAKVLLNISIKDGQKNNVQAKRHFFNYVLNTLKDKEIKIVELNSGNEFIKVNNHNTQNGISIEAVEHKVKFFDALLKIEKYFNFKFDFPKELDPYDLEKVNILHAIVEGTSLHGTFESYPLICNSPSALGGLIKSFEGTEGLKFMIGGMLNQPLEVFGQSVSNIKQENRFDNVIIENIEKIKQKHSCMDEGDAVRINLIPGTDNKLETIYTIDN
ncbi:hypothetical protein [Priestia megaterium]|uniref:hypothetical protein n=1 Tax=Priestia megaterium TaxID=1404 RepID=UPI001C218E3A|nr:hypothetical protein [Priestia megaterium]MBU8757649.1 hypothetical protein [Priestia megaterium]